VDLLRRPVGPFRSNVVRCVLNPEPPLSVDHDAVPIAIRVNDTADESWRLRSSAAIGTGTPSPVVPVDATSRQLTNASGPEETHFEPAFAGGNLQTSCALRGG
jgi:hypothetical protein